MLTRRIAAVSALLVVLAAPVAFAQDPQAPPVADQPRIAAGVTAGGVDVSGLTVAEASAKLYILVTPALKQDLILGVAGKPWTLTAEKAKVRFDADKTAKTALAAVPGTADGAGGIAPKTDVPLALSHARLAVRDFVAKIARSVHRSGRDATLKITLRRMVVRRAKIGRNLDRTAAQQLVNDALDGGLTERVLHMRLDQERPKTNADDLRKQYATVITVDKSAFKLRLFKHLKLSKTYGVAVGQPAYPTPTGLFHIQDKQVNPVWSVPNSPWAGELGGTTVAGGSAANPLKARWMGVTDGVGIHGTGSDYSIGSRASHGCIRMHVWDVVDLYPRVPVGTPVLLR